MEPSTQQMRSSVVSSGSNSGSESDLQRLMKTSKPSRAFSPDITQGHLKYISKKISGNFLPDIMLGPSSHHSTNRHAESPPMNPENEEIGPVQVAESENEPNEEAEDNTQATSDESDDGSATSARNGPVPESKTKGCPAIPDDITLGRQLQNSAFTPSQASSSLPQAMGPARQQQQIQLSTSGMKSPEFALADPGGILTPIAGSAIRVIQPWSNMPPIHPHNLMMYFNGNSVRLPQLQELRNMAQQTWESKKSVLMKRARNNSPQKLQASKKKGELKKNMKTTNTETATPPTSSTRPSSSSAPEKRSVVLYQKVHTAERAFPCEICGARLSTKQNLGRHLETIHGQPRNGNKGGG